MSDENFRISRPLQNEPRRKDGILLSSIYDDMMDLMTNGDHSKKKSQELANIWQSNGYIATVGIPAPAVRMPEQGLIWVPRPEDHKAVYVRFTDNAQKDAIIYRGIHLRSTKNEVSVHNYDTSTEEGKAASAKALVSHAKSAWDGQMEVFGDDNFKQRVWSEAQKQGVHIANYRPAPIKLRDPHFKFSPS